MNRGAGKSTKKSAALAENILEGILVLDAQGTILYCNRSVVKMFGYKSPKEGVGKNVYSFLTPQYKKKVTENLARVLRGEWGFLAPYKVKTRHGKKFWVESLGKKITYQHKPAELVVLRDITTRRHSQDVLTRAKHALEKKVLKGTSELKVINKRLRRENRERKKAENKLQQSLERFQRLLKETVGSLASVVEAKDPFTSGHQKRVAQLACAIAAGMGLSNEQINGIYMAAIVHDIGKIHIPAEVLAKPSRLNELERSMINTHTKFSYEILKAIEFPWPIADIVYQHHERMDGSGYPKGLTGKEILPEAKILAVADVVEAISSHRPYRPALGIDKAMEEITQEKSTLYDANVVNACIKLFTKKRFKFKQ
jgi:PAS domain S-box-containing protein/putative nucleotidyltransferase with HDIG domain